MREEDFAELRSALHARDIHGLHVAIPKLTPEYERYARDHLDQWDTGTHWDLGLGVDRKIMSAMRVEGASNPLLASRLLRVTLGTGEVWYEREVFEVDATHAAALLACDVAADVLAEAGVTHSPTLELLELQRGRLAGEVDAGRVQRARRRAEQDWTHIGEGSPRSDRARWAAIAASDGVAARALSQAIMSRRWLDPAGPASPEFWNQSVGGLFRAAERLMGGSIRGAAREATGAIVNFTDGFAQMLGDGGPQLEGYGRRLEALIHAERGGQ